MGWHRAAAAATNSARHYALHAACQVLAIDRAGGQGCTVWNDAKVVGCAVDRERVALLADSQGVVAALGDQCDVHGVPLEPAANSRRVNIDAGS